MDALSFLPGWPPAANPVLVFGLLLAAGLAGGELAQRLLRLPRITGYVIAGLALGGSGLSVLDEALLREARVFVDVALGLILFELGRRLDLGWLRRDHWLAATCFAECAAAFVCIYFALVYFGIQPLYAAVAAAIGISTSPAVVMLVAQESRAEGQVTERALNMVAINSVVSLIALTMLLTWVHREHRADWATVVLHPVYLLAGALALGSAIARLAIACGRWLGKRPERHLVMLIALILFAVGAAVALHLPVLIALLTFGVMVRHLDRGHHLMAVDVGKVAQIFFVVLFVATGAMLPVMELVVGGTIGLVYLLARFVGKSAVVLSLSHLSGMRRGSGGALALMLTPMSGLAIVMVQSTIEVYPEFGARLAAIVLSAVLVLDLAGPLAVRFALCYAGEADAEREAA